MCLIVQVQQAETADRLSEAMNGKKKKVILIYDNFLPKNKYF